MSERGLQELLRTKRVIVCVGAGGVGKTTVSAALGLAAARRGRRVLVCTIDPARRLANALGIRELGNEVYRVPDETLRASGLELPEGGAFSAMMLDTKRTFDRLIERQAPSPEAAKRMLENPVYQQFSSQLAGSQEYMAMEKLYELHMEGGYDLIVLDTPPSRHALDFLHAPRRLADFLEGSILRWFLTPLQAGGRMGGMAGRVAQRVIGWLDKLFGMQLLEDLAEFFAAFETLWGGFKRRAEQVNGLLRRGDLAGFLVVSSATRETVSEAAYFHEQLRVHDLPVSGFVVNRVHPDLLGEVPSDAPLARAAADPEARARLRGELRAALAGDPPLCRAVLKALESLADAQAIAEADRRNRWELERAAAAEQLLLRPVPAFDHDVYDIAGLLELERHLIEAEELAARP